MKKRFFITLLIAFVFVCIFAISVNAENMGVYATARVQTNDGVWHDIFCPSERWEGRIQLEDGLYTTIDNTSEKIDPQTVISVDMTDSVTYYWDSNAGTYKTSVAKNFYSAGKNFSNVSTLILSENTERIRGAVCKDWTSLTEVYIPAKVHTIHNDAFNGCTNLKKVVFDSDSVLVNVMGQSFINCSSLEEFVFPASVSSIDDNAFNGCKSLKKIVISSTTTKISGGAFRNCPSDATIYVVGDNPSEVITKLKANSSYASLESQTYVSGESYSSCIVTDYSVCEAYYNNEHTLGNVAYVVPESYITYAYDRRHCSECSYFENVKEYKPIILLLGFSAKETNNKISMTYKLDKESILKYETETNKVLSIGVTASMDIDSSCEEYESVNSDLSPKGNSISAPIDKSYDSISFIISGFTAELYTRALIMCAYVSDGETINYIDNDCKPMASVFTFADKMI